MPINYFIYDDVIDSFIEFETNEEYLYYYLCLQYYNELNNIEYMNKFNSNTKKRNTYTQNTYKYNIKNKRFKK